MDKRNHVDVEIVDMVEIVGGVDVGIIASICNLEPPHFQTHQTDEVYLYIYLSLQICVSPFRKHLLIMKSPER